VDRVIVTVKLVDEARVRDVELSANIPVAQLARALAQRLGWNQEVADQQVIYDVEVYPPGRRLNPNETLAQAHIWDGAWLVFHPRLLDAPPVMSKLDIAWEPLNQPMPQLGTAAPAAHTPDAGSSNTTVSPSQPLPIVDLTPLPTTPATPASAADDTVLPMESGDAPVIGWIPLDLPKATVTPPPHSERPAAPPPSDIPRGWRRIDED
jgi:hypothetical protein